MTHVTTTETTETTMGIEELVARLLCAQRDLDPDKEVISGPIAAPTGREPTWHFWREDAKELIALIDSRWGGEAVQRHD